MCHTVQYGNTTGILFEELIGTIAICLQVTFKVFKYSLWTFSSSACLIVKENQPCYTVVIHPIVAPVRFSFLVFIQHFDGCLVCMQVITGCHFLFQSFIQWLYQPAAIVYPVSKRSIGDSHVFPGKALLLAVQRQMIYILVYNRLCKQSCPCYGFWKRSVGYWGYQYCFVVFAYILRTYIAVDKESARLIVQLFGYFLSNAAKSG